MRDHHQRVTWESCCAAIRGTAGLETWGCVYYWGKKRNQILTTQVWSAFIMRVNTLSDQFPVGHKPNSELTRNICGCIEGNAEKKKLLR